ncbi:MAG: DUF3152 domain-containing protein [Actinomycetota bacterium]|nr:DUF3152 domain-containing protein [Actinomycetota bacterium]
MRTGRRRAVLALCLVLAMQAACRDGGQHGAPGPEPPATTAPATVASPDPPVPAPPVPPAGATSPAEVEVAYRVERRTTDRATEGFAAVVESTLSDRRGWSRAGFRLVRRPQAPFLIVLAEGGEVDRLCLPYDTYGTYSCQNGPVVALNADRWRSATPQWTGTLTAFRQMLVNHEVGHLLGQRHPRRHCPRPGRPAPVMAQQSTELNGCLPNPWPLPDEVRVAGRHDQPLAPAFGREAPRGSAAVGRGTARRALRLAVPVGGEVA